MLLKVLAICIFMVANASHGEPLRFALIDGTGITYSALPKDCLDFPNPCPRPNLEALEIIIPKYFEGADTHPFNVNRRVNGAFPGADDVADWGPQIVMVHWSSFEEAENIPCYPNKNGGKGDECARAIIDLLADIYVQREVDILIYSRKSGICEDDFNKPLRSIVYEKIKNQPKLRKFPSDIGFMAMTKNTEMRNFYTSTTQGRLKTIVKSLTTDSPPDWKRQKRQGLCILSSLR